MTVTFQRWTEIKQLSNVHKSVTACKEIIESNKELEDAESVFKVAFNSKIDYRSKIKLHGTKNMMYYVDHLVGQNAAITIENGDFRIQSRSQFMDENSVLGKYVYKPEVKECIYL
jgi:hypothetical protein